jgi:hypothetical protein
MRHEKNLPSALTPLDQRSAAGQAVTRGISHENALLARANTPAETADVCAELFKFCKQCDEKYLQPRRIQCLFDVDGGAMHRAALQIVCEVIETLLADIAESGVCHSKGASLTVTLRRQHGVWILALTERRIESLRQTATVRRLSLVRRRAQLLGAACRVHETNEGLITALMFDCAAVTSGWGTSAKSAAVH